MKGGSFRFCIEVECSAALRKSLSERRHTLSHESKYVNEVFENNRIVRMSALIKKVAVVAAC
jgi:hypothetical protein